MSFSSSSGSGIRSYMSWSCTGRFRLPDHQLATQKLAFVHGKRMHSCLHAGTWVYQSWPELSVVHYMTAAVPCGTKGRTECSPQ